ncbi:MAG: DUF4249 domain-containing protein [Bacteroidales bacterium]|nr:DUF4249 domain-containing protein [Bacteroidales bacterium]
MMKYLISIFSIILISSCNEDILPEPKCALVIEGWIEDGGFPIVMVSQTIPISSNYNNLDSIGDFIVKWATVKVSDGEQTVNLTGKYAPKYFPPYIYTTSKMRGECGKTYKLTVEYADYYAVAHTTIPNNPPMVYYEVKQCSDSDTLYMIRARFKDVLAEKNYYQFFVKVGANEKQFYASYLGTIDDIILNGVTEMTVYRGHNIENKDYTPYFTSADSVAVKFATLDVDSYLFWDDYLKNQSLSGNMFLTGAKNIRSNILGGYGCWCGYGVDIKYISIGDSVSNNI